MLFFYARPYLQLLHMCATFDDVTAVLFITLATTIRDVCEMRMMNMKLRAVTRHPSILSRIRAGC